MRTCLPTARDDAVLCSTPCFSCSAAVLSLRADLRESLSTGERQSKSVAFRLARGTHESAMLLIIIAREPSFDFPFFSPLPLPGAAGLEKYGPAHRDRGVACTVLERTPSAGAGRHPPPRRGSAAGTLLAPQAEFFRGGAGGGRFGGHMGRCGPKTNFLGALSLTLRGPEISSRRVDRVPPYWGVNSAICGVQWGAFRLAAPPDIQVDAWEWEWECGGRWWLYGAVGLGWLVAGSG